MSAPGWDGARVVRTFGDSPEGLNTHQLRLDPIEHVGQSSAQMRIHGCDGQRGRLRSREVANAPRRKASRAVAP
jgi:hypothetical protein